MSTMNRLVRRAHSVRFIVARIAVEASTIVALGAAMLSPLAAGAHSQSGNLGTSSSATDYYDVACYDDGHGQPTSLEIQILDASPGAAPRVAVQVQHGTTLSSAADGLIADIQPSASIYLNGGAVTYVVLIDKTGAGVKFYELTYHCWTGPDGTGIHTGSSLVTRQSQ